MAKCSSCSAPLLPNNSRCAYCNVRNDIDLHGRHKYTIKTRHSKRLCPHCERALQTIELNLSSPFYIERCILCFGLFFDPGEIGELLESSVSNVFSINFKLIKNINKERYQKNKNFRYVKCPVCRIHMNRVNFGFRSGVVIDQCKKHGVWMDSGEITHLMEWKKAGGELLNIQNTGNSKAKKKAARPFGIGYSPPLYRQKFEHWEADMLGSISSFVHKLFSTSSV